LINQSNTQIPLYDTAVIYARQAVDQAMVGAGGVVVVADIVLAMAASPGSALLGSAFRGLHMAQTP